MLHQANSWTFSDGLRHRFPDLAEYDIGLFLQIILKHFLKYTCTVLADPGPICHTAGIRVARSIKPYSLSPNFDYNVSMKHCPKRSCRVFVLRLPFCLDARTTLRFPDPNRNVFSRVSSYCCSFHPDSQSQCELPVLWLRFCQWWWSILHQYRLSRCLLIRHVVRRYGSVSFSVNGN